jgi:hypothetical protein
MWSPSPAHITVDLLRSNEWSPGLGNGNSAVVTSGSEGKATMKRRTRNQRLEEELAAFEAEQYAKRVGFRAWADEWCVRQEQRTRRIVERIRAADDEAKGLELERVVRLRCGW